jgi:trk system potassium uptake protein TrkA
MKRTVVIGLGIFGFNVVKELFQAGIEVIAIDKDKDVVQRIRDFSTKAIVADGTDKEVMALLSLLLFSDFE